MLFDLSWLEYPMLLLSFFLLYSWMQQCFQQWFQQTTTTILKHHFNLYFLMLEEKLCKKIVSHPSVRASYGLAGLHSWPGTHRDNSNHIAFHEMIIRQPLSSKKWTLLHASVGYTYSLARCFALLLLMLLCCTMGQAHRILRKVNV